MSLSNTPLTAGAYALAYDEAGAPIAAPSCPGSFRPDLRTPRRSVDPHAGMRGRQRQGTARDLAFFPIHHPEIGRLMALWIAIGVGAGTALGAAFGNPPIGTAVGVAVGAAIGAVTSRKSR